MNNHRSLALLMFAALGCSALSYGQGKLGQAEEKELTLSLSEAGNSPVEFARVLEAHLKKYPNSPQKDELIKALVKSALEANDKRRILVWGERSLEKNPDQPQVLERVARILLESDDKDSSERAQKYARRFEEGIRTLSSDAPTNPRQEAQFHDEYDRAIGRGLALQARATGNLGKIDEAVALAQKSFETYPSHESAREAAKWLAKSG